MSRKDLSLQKYGISVYRYRELYYHCLQYEEFKKNKETRHYAEQIEAAAKDASPDLYEPLMQNITQGITVDEIDIPMENRAFYAARRRLYVILSEKMKEHKNFTKLHKTGGRYEADKGTENGFKADI